MSISYKTPVSFSDFTCLGGECEDTCCRNWEIKLDRQHFDLLKFSMSKDLHENNIFEQHIHLNESSITSDHDYAFIRMGDNGYCAMLDNKGLCSVHANHGVNVLGDVCTMFPRVISRCGDTVELSGALSCPEVVRNCIDEVLPLKLHRFKPSELPRKNYPIQRELSNIEDDYYSENFEVVRRSLMQIMANEGHGFETRLYVLANLANKISGFYHRGCNKLLGNKLESTLQEFSSDDFISILNTMVNEYDGGPINMIVVNSILSIKIEQSGKENISLLYQDLIKHYQLSENTNLAEELTIYISQIQSQLDEDSQDYIDKAITRYIINCLYREWFISMPDPFTYVQMLIVRMSIIRTLIYLDIGREEKLNSHILRQKIVYIMYNFARNIDQNLEFLKVVYNALSEQTMINFDFSLAFICMNSKK